MFRKKPLLKFPLYVAVLLLLNGVMSCRGDDPGETDITDGEQYEVQPLRVDFPGQGVVKAKYDRGYYLVLLEKLSALERIPGERSVKVLNLTGEPVMAIGASPSVLIDADLENGLIYTVSIVPSTDNESVVVEQYESTGQKVRRYEILEEINNVDVFDDRVRIAAGKQTVYVAVFKNDGSTYLYARDAFTLHEKWSLLVEPDVHRTPWGMVGGSYDAFGQMAQQYSVYLTIDDSDCAYVAIRAMGGKRFTTLHYHNKHFGEALTYKSDSPGDNGTPTDALVTKVHPDGQRVFTSVMGTAYQDEIHGIRVFNNKVVTYGRSVITDFNDWDPYVALYDAATGDEVFVKNYDLGSNELFLAVGYDALEASLLVGGVGGWSQNPGGVSISEQGYKVMLSLDETNGTVTEIISLQNGARQNQVYAIQIIEENFLLVAGWENGPGTHSGDGNSDLVSADGFLEVRLKD